MRARTGTAQLPLRGGRAPAWLRAAVTKAGIDRSERVAALKRLVSFGEERVKRRMAEQAQAASEPFEQVRTSKE